MTARLGLRPAAPPATTTAPPATATTMAAPEPTLPPEPEPVHGSAPDIAGDTVPGSGNFCLLTEDPVDWLVENAAVFGVEIIAGPGSRDGATGPLRSVYFRDPDGNLVEVSNTVQDDGGA